MRTIGPKSLPQTKCFFRGFFFPLIILFTFSFPASLLYSQTENSDLEAQVKAAYIYNFTKFLDWKQNNAEHFKITVFGKSNATRHLKILASKEKVKGKDLVVNEITDLSDLGSCNILYLQTENRNLLNEALKRIKDNNILLITNANGFAEKGAGINFLIINGKIKFEINRKALEAQSIIPNSSLLSLAYKVYE